MVIEDSTDSSNISANSMTQSRLASVQNVVLTIDNSAETWRTN